MLPYRAGGTGVFPCQAGESPNIGSELDIVASWGVNRNLSVQLGSGQLQFRFRDRTSLPSSLVVEHLRGVGS